MHQNGIVMPLVNVVKDLEQNNHFQEFQHVTTNIWRSPFRLLAFFSILLLDAQVKSYKFLPHSLCV